MALSAILQLTVIGARNTTLQDNDEQREPTKVA
jgi:hypothetical protein